MLGSSGWTGWTRRRGLRRRRPCARRSRPASSRRSSSAPVGPEREPRLVPRAHGAAFGVVAGQRGADGDRHHRAGGGASATCAMRCSAWSRPSAQHTSGTGDTTCAQACSSRPTSSCASSAPAGRGERGCGGVRPSRRPRGAPPSASNRCSPASPTRDHEWRAVRPDGAIRYLSGSAEPVFDGAGNVVAVFGVTQDVTDRAEALQAAEGERGAVPRPARATCSRASPTAACSTTTRVARTTSSTSP